MLLYDGNGDPIEEPLAPEQFPDADPGWMGMNYRNAPFVLRDSADPAYVFSSYVYGDPWTPVMQAYAGDKVRFRIVQGSQEEQHVLNIHGYRWRDEADDPEAPLVNSRALGVSDAPNFETAPLGCENEGTCVGDYLVSGGGATDDLWTGMWGIFRLNGRQVPHLLPLEDDLRVRGPAAFIPERTNLPPARAIATANVCPADAPIKQFDIVAIEKDIVYDDAGDHDPYGLMYVLAEDEIAVLNNTKATEPLVIRANEGDCIKVNLENKLTTAWLEHTGSADGDAPQDKEPATGTPGGLRISLHASLVKYDVRHSDGATVGYNLDQTAGPGQTATYWWYADNPSTTPGELGAINLLDYGDIRGHRHHGLFAGLVIEPAGSTYHDPVTGAQVKSGTEVVIRTPGVTNDFREFIVFFQDGLNLRAWNSQDTLPDFFDPLNPGVDAERAGIADEDRGSKAFNYRNASFWRRLNRPWGSPLDRLQGTDMANVMSFVANPNGDPETPVFEANAGDRVRFRILQGSDKPRQHSFGLAGHAWYHDPLDPQSNLISAQSGISVGKAHNIFVTAGGVQGATGDYLFRCEVNFRHLSGGLWGLLRVGDAAGSQLQPLELPAATITGLAIALAPANAGAATIPAGSPGFDLVVTGTGFDVGSVVKFAGLAMVTTFVSPTELIAAIPASSVLNQGPKNVVVETPGRPASAAFIFTVTPPIGAASEGGTFYFTVSGVGTIPGVGAATDEDIYKWDGAAYSIVFDGSDVGLAAYAIDAFDIQPDGSILLSFAGAFTAPSTGTAATKGLGAVDDSDVIRFIPGAGSTGATTVGTFKWFLDGSDFGLSDAVGVDNEDIDALHYTAATGKFYYSTTGTAAMTGLSAIADRDIVVCTLSSTGTLATAATTTSTCTSPSFYFDGDDAPAGLTLAGEDIDGITIGGGATPAIYISTLGAAAVPGVAAAADEDVIKFTPGAGHTGPTTAGTWTMHFDGSVKGLPTTLNLTDIDLGP